MITDRVKAASVGRAARVGINSTGVLAMIIGALALALRAYNLSGRSLWLDEIATASASSSATVGEVVVWSQADINGMPLFYMLTWLLARLGDHEVLLRLPSVVAGTLTVIGVYLLGERLLGRRAGLFAAILFGLLPFAVWYSQEARNYALLMLLTTLQMLFAVNSVKRGRPWDWVGLAVFTTLSLYTHYLALAATAAMVLYVGIILLSRLLEEAGNVAKIGVVAGVLALGGASALVPWRATLKPLLTYATGEAAQHRPLSLLGAAVIAAAPSVVVAVFLAWRATRSAKLAATGALFLLLVALVVLLRPDPLSLASTRFSFWEVVALAAVLAALLLAAGWLALDLLHSSAAAVRALWMPFGCAVFVAVAYSPWLPYLRVFLSRPDQSVNRYNQLHRPTVAEVAAVLAGLDLSGILLAAFGLGLAAITIWLFRGRAKESALLLCWIAVPVLVLWQSLRGGIVLTEVRYFAFLVPAWVLVVAAGLDAAVAGFERAVQRLPRLPQGRLAAIGIPLVLALLLLAQPAAALLASYQAPKQDWRAVSSHIVVGSPAGSTVLAVGDYSDFAVMSLRYYFKRLNSPISIYDGRQVNSDVSTRLATGQGVVWGVTVLQSPAQLALIANSSEEKTDFLDVTGFVRVVRSVDAGLSPVEQARTPLRWQMPIAPALGASLQVLDLLSARAERGPNLIGDLGQSGPVGWQLGPGTQLDGENLILTPTRARPEVDASFTAEVQAGQAYLFSFDFRSDGLTGQQLAFASVNRSGRLLFTFPDEGGYQCGHSAVWKRSYFAFEALDQATSATLLLRATGRGEADFRAIELSRLSPVRIAP